MQSPFFTFEYASYSALILPLFSFRLFNFGYFIPKIVCSKPLGKLFPRLFEIDLSACKIFAFKIFSVSDFRLCASTCLFALSHIC